MGYKMGKSLTSRKSAHSFFPGKNRIRKIREKSGYKNPGIFDQILVNIHKTCYIYETHKMAKSLTSPNLPTYFPGKNRIRKIREKSRSKISRIFDQILVNIYRKGLIYEIKPRFF